MTTILDDAALSQLFTAARSLHTYTSAPVTDDTLRQLYGLLSMGPTAFNSQPGRYVFVKSPDAKAKLIPTLSGSNQDKSMKAPVTVIVAYDTKFYTSQKDLGEKIVGMMSQNTALAESTAFRNSTLQGAYLIMAARALGLTAGPMSGFDTAQVNREFFPDGQYQVNFLVNLGYCDHSEPRPRAPRLPFDSVATIA